MTDIEMTKKWKNISKGTVQLNKNSLPKFWSFILFCPRYGRYCLFNDEIAL